MLKLKELLELDKMKYGNSIKEKHKKRMKRELVYINNPIIPHNPPPINSSRETLKELHWLRDYNNGLVNEVMVKEGDDVKVKVIGFDRGKVKLSMKQATE